MHSALLRTACLSLVLVFLAPPSTRADEQSPADAGQSRTASKQPGNGKDGVARRRVPNFVLADSTGKQVALADYGEAEFVVVVFLGTKCPIANAYMPDLLDLQRRYRDRKVQLLGVNSNLSD